jgi:hypothetical protein
MGRDNAEILRSVFTFWGGGSDKVLVNHDNAVVNLRMRDDRLRGAQRNVRHPIPPLRRVRAADDPLTAPFSTGSDAVESYCSKNGRA